MPRQILAIGGGGFDTDKPTPRMDAFFLGLSAKPRPKICLIPTASGDSILRIGRFLRACSSLDCQPSVLELFSTKTEDIVDFLSSMDCVFVSGGNTRNMLVLWREWGVDAALKTAYENGVVMGGVSAGANCWFEQCSTDSNPGRLSVMPCLGWIEGSFCPHYDSEPDRRPTLRSFLENGEIKPGWAAEEKVGVLFTDETFTGVFSEESGCAYAVRQAGETVLGNNLS